MSEIIQSSGGDWLGWPSSSCWGELPPLVIESACRRPGWTDAGPIPLRGRLTLHLPLLDAPTVRVFALMRQLGPELPALQDAWDADGGGDGEAFLEWFGAATTIAAGLLAANYAVDPRDLADLFPLDAAEQGSTAEALRGYLGDDFQAWLAAQPDDLDAPGFDYGQGWYHDGWSLREPPEVEPAPLVERHRRKPGWTPGAPVTLAEGRGWRLPLLDATLVVGVPGLLAEVMELYPLALAAMKKLEDLPDPADPHARAMASLDFSRQLVRLAMLLVAENYELSDGDRARLLPGSDAWGVLYRDAEAPIMAAFHGPWAPALVGTLPGSGLDLTIN